jgi:hypothetical protein
MGIPGCGLCLSGPDIIPGFTGFVHRPNFYEKDLKKEQTMLIPGIFVSRVIVFMGILL